ncbi:MAG: tetratricopeptide repeat protein [Anaerolineae bacterium]|nr:tetratricopeptide repeat protein [Anaerolineae bacterium]
MALASPANPTTQLQSVHQLLRRVQEEITSGHYQQAVQLATEGLDLIDPLPSSPEQEHLRWDLLLHRGRARVLMGDYTAISDFQTIRDHSPDPVQQVEALIGAADCRNGMGEYIVAEEEYQRALQEAETHGSNPSRIRAWIGMGTLYWKQGRIEEAIRTLNRARSTLQRTPDLYELGRALLGLGIAYDFAGQVEEAITAYEDALKCFRSLRDDHRTAAALNNVGELYQELRDLDRALRYHEEAALLASQSGADRISIDITRNLGVDMLLLGRYSEAMLALNQALSRAREIRDKDLALQALYNLGDAFLRQGTVDRALAIARELADEAAAIRSELHAARARLLQGRAYLAQGDRLTAQSVLQAALGHAHAIPSRWLLWQFHAALGRATDDPQIAQVHFRIAADFIHQIADPLSDPTLRSRFLSQPEIQAVLRRAEETQP